MVKLNLLVSSGILHGDTLAPFLFIIVINYILRISVDTMKENGLLRISLEEAPDILTSSLLMLILRMRLRYCQIFCL